MKKAFLKNLCLVLSLILVIGFTSSSLPFITLNQNVSSSKKVSADFAVEKQLLFEKMKESSNDDYIPIFVFLDSFDFNDVYEKLLKEKNIDYRDYEVNERFENKIIPQIKTVCQDYASSTLNLGETYETFEKELDKKVLEIKKEYLVQKRNCVKEIVTSMVNSFISSLDKEKIEIITKGESVEYLVLNVKNSYIKNIINRPEVVGYGYYESINVTPLTAISTTSNNQSKMNMDIDSDYLGDGICIGILEAIESKRDDDGNRVFCAGWGAGCPHISAGSTGSRFTWIDNPSISRTITQKTDHTTMVASIAAGSAVTYNGVTYRGAAPEATVVATACETFEDIKDGLDILIEAGADIINCSFGFGSSYMTYSAVDQYFDWFVINYAIAIVVASGNNAQSYIYDDVLSPAKAYNVITVGNLNTTTTGSSYQMANSSSYDQSEETKRTNKPDIVASGVNISTVSYGGLSLMTNSGTSLAAPYITGIAARLMEQDSSLLYEPERLKAILMLSADPDKVSGDTACLSEYNTGDTLLLYRKSGAGFVDAQVCQEIVTNGTSENYYTGWMTSSEVPDGGYQTLETINVPSGKTLRAVLTYFKNDSSEISNGYGTNIDIQLKKVSSGTVVAYSESLYNNTEIIEFTATAATAGTYYIQYAIDSVAEVPSGVYYAIAWNIE